MTARDIEAREQQWLAAFNSGDAAGVAKLYAEKGRIHPPNDEIVEGRADIEAFVKGFVQTGAQLKFETLTIYESAALCAAVGLYQMEIPTPAGLERDHGKFIEVWTRGSDGTWTISDDIFNSSVQAPATS